MVRENIPLFISFVLSFCVLCVGTLVYWYCKDIEVFDPFA